MIKPFTKAERRRIRDNARTVSQVFLTGHPWSDKAFVRADDRIELADYISGTMTTCHRLTPEQEARIRAARQSSTVSL